MNRNYLNYVLFIPVNVDEDQKKLVLVNIT